MTSRVVKVLCQLQKLQILYYHGNAVSDLKEVDTLSRIKTLIKLSLHGNPIDQHIGVCLYKFMLLTPMPCSLYICPPNILNPNVYGTSHLI